MGQKILGQCVNERMLRRMQVSNWVLGQEILTKILEHAGR